MDRIGTFGRISAAKNTYHALEYGHSARHGLHGWALDTFAAAERALAEKGALPASDTLFAIDGRALGNAGARVDMITAVRFALETWATGIIRPPRSGVEFPVLATAPGSRYRGKPIVLGERAGVVLAFRVYDAVDGAALQAVATRELGADGTIDALLAKRAATVAALRGPLTGTSREEAIARVDLLRAIDEDAQKSGGLNWLLLGPEVLDRVKRAAEIREHELKSARERVRNGDVAPQKVEEPLRDPADDLLPPPPSPEKKQRSEHVIALERLDEMKRESAGVLTALVEREANRLGVTVEEAQRLFAEAEANGGAS